MTRRRPDARAHEDRFKVKSERSWPWWRVFARLSTCIVPGWALSCLGWSPSVQQAWREKIALCVVFGAMCVLLGFITFGLGPVLCPASAYASRILFSKLQEGTKSGRIKACWAFGTVYDATSIASLANAPVDAVLGQDISSMFAIDVSPECTADFEPRALAANCTEGNTCWETSVLEKASKIEPSVIAYEWPDIANDSALRVVAGTVVRIPSNPVFLDESLESLLRSSTDVSHGLKSTSYRGTVAMACLGRVFKTGQVSLVTPGCAVFDVFQVFALAAIGLLIVIKFTLAVLFSWLLSRRIDRVASQPRPSDTWADPPAVAPVVARTMLDMLGATEPCASTRAALRQCPPHPRDTQPFVLLLVTCYSEGEEGLRTTLDSLAHTDYDDSRKLLFVIADGQVTGSGNSAPTPSIVRGMMDLDNEIEPSARPATYHAVPSNSSASLAVNAAVVHAGHYVSRQGRRVPCMLVEKVGNSTEMQGAGMDETARILHTDPRDASTWRGCPTTESAPGKPGNRGKRDSQLILMGFVSRLLLGERLCPLDMELFVRMFWLMGVPADAFETVLMVDADTAVSPKALGRMVAAMQQDPLVMGLCGETRIANKGASWVSAIQVFEYYVSHHLGKAFEAVFGGVTCLPGCFCMYRLHAPKGAGMVVPVLASPLVLDQYSQTDVATLHEKNLLLLGEDRFLTTVLMRTFPRRKMIFVPRATCHTIVPDAFRVLVSQRRRWINSTIHNLVELVRVPDLCGVFCCSMQFAIFMELVGTIVLPAAIVFTGVLIVNAVFDPLGALVPLTLLAMVLGLPAVLIVLTSRRLVYVAWMAVYLAALPVWNLVLPVYAYWHMDDFSWGATRPTQGGGGGHGAAPGDGASAAGASGGDAVPMRTWLSWSAWWHGEAAAPGGQPLGKY